MNITSEKDFQQSFSYVLRPVSRVIEPAVEEIRNFVEVFDCKVKNIYPFYRIGNKTPDWVFVHYKRHKEIIAIVDPYARYELAYGYYGGREKLVSRFTRHYIKYNAGKGTRVGWSSNKALPPWEEVEFKKIEPTGSNRAVYLFDLMMMS